MKSYKKVPTQYIYIIIKIKKIMWKIDLSYCRFLRLTNSLKHIHITYRGSHWHYNKNWVTTVSPCSMKHCILHQIHLPPTRVATISLFTSWSNKLTIAVVNLIKMKMSYMLTMTDGIMETNDLIYYIQGWSKSCSEILCRQQRVHNHNVMSSNIHIWNLVQITGY